MRRRAYGFLGFVLLTSGNISAGTLLIATAPGALSPGGNPVDVLSTVITSTDSISVELDDLLVDPLAVDQVITGVSFILNFHDTNAISISSSMGQLINIPAKRSAPQDTTDAIDHWGVSSSNPTSSTTAIDLSAFFGNGPPSDGIIGHPGSNGLYNNVNDSITNGHAAPFILSDGTFVLYLKGVTSATTVSSVVFTLGTNRSGTVNSRVMLVAPEPGSWSMFLLGCVLLAAGAPARARNKDRRA